MPTYCLVMIVKDEAERVARTIASVRQLITYWVIVDTGSTDGTQDVVRKALSGVPGELHDRPWVDFGHNRSEAFALAKGKADWLIASDADMVWSIDRRFVPDPRAQMVLVEMGEGSGFTWELPLLLRGDIDWVSVGAIHEYTARADGERHPAMRSPLVHVQYEDRSSREKSEWHESLLRAEVEKDPANTRTWFYLAQTVRELGRPEEAQQLYAKRASMAGMDEEKWYSMYWAAALEPDADQALLGLMECWCARPHRVEPLYLLCRSLNLRKQHAMVYNLLRHPFPMTTDRFFVHDGAWKWGLDSELSIAALAMGNVGLARDLNRKLMKRKDLPEQIRATVERNMAYTERDRGGSR